jgi:arylsulfatase
LFGLLFGASLAAAADKPNIILILADDMGFSDLGCYGSEIHTPHLDRLAEEGLRFTQFYNLPRCWPTRASLLTGLYSHQTGIEHRTRKELTRRAVTIAEALRAAGYRTAMSGKWHLTTSGAGPENWPRQRGFERYFGIIGGAASFYDATATVLENEPQTAVRTDFHLTDAITEHAAAFIGELAGPAAPFFLYVAYSAPHWPLHARPEDIARYRARANSMHANLSVGEPGAGAWELYDLEQDRTETRNLASAHPALVRELAAQYDAWAARVGATLR